MIDIIRFKGVPLGNVPKGEVLLLTGDKHSGKTTLLQTWVNELKAEGVEVSGYLSTPVMAEGSLSGYDLFDLEKKKYTPLLRRNGQAGWQRTGAFYLLPEGLELACAILKQRSGQVCVVDEVGPLELEGRGVAPVLWESLRKPALRYILVARRSIRERILERLDRRLVHIVDLVEGRNKALEQLSRFSLSLHSRLV